MKNKKNKRFNFFMLAGLLLMLGAVALMCSNLWREYKAKLNSAEVLSVLEELPQPAPTATPAPTADGSADVDEGDKGEKADKGGAMPETEINGNLYVGILDIPDLGLKLPVMRELNYKKLDIAPCVYKGSVYDDDLIIAAHNFKTHFGRIKDLKKGSPISFTDIEGNVFSYSVIDNLDINGHDGNKMEEDGDWDMTLFTCTYSGAARVTVRCKKISDQDT